MIRGLFEVADTVASLGGRDRNIGSYPGPFGT